MLETLHAVIEAGATRRDAQRTLPAARCRMVREATKQLPHPPAI